MENIVIEQGAGAEPAPAAPASTPPCTERAAIQEPGGEPFSAPPTGAGVGVPPGAEDSLIREVRQLWDNHREALAAAKRSKGEALAILLELGKRLSEAKGRLARPGRNGGWSSFAQSVGFSRAEANGLVRRYGRTLKPQAPCAAGAVAAEQPQEPALASADQAADGAEARLDKAGEVAGSVPAAESAPQLSGEASADIEEPALEAAAAPTEAVQAPAVADAAGGAVA